MDKSELLVVEDAPLHYVVSLPEAEPAGTSPRPILCFLHGYDEAAPLNIRSALTRHGPLRPGSSPEAVGEFIVIAPQLPRAGDLWHRYADAVQAIISEVQRSHDGDRQRTYLSGFSFGGNGVFDLASAQPELWAALWAVDPTRVPRSDPGLPVWLSFGEVSRRQKDAFIRALNLEPVAANAGGDRVYLDEGQDHVGSATLAYRDDRIYRWLRSRRPSGAG